MWFEHLQVVQENRKKGAAKAAKTRRENARQRQEIEKGKKTGKGKEARKKKENENTKKNGKGKQVDTKVVLNFKAY